MENKVKLFEQKKVRTHWDEKTEKWFFSIIDVIEILTGSERGRKYWKDLKTKLKKEGSELSAKIGQLKMESEMVVTGENFLPPAKKIKEIKNRNRK